MAAEEGREAGRRDNALNIQFDTAVLADLAGGVKHIGKMVTCLVEGPKGPPPIVPPPKGFRVRAEQSLNEDDGYGTLHLSFKKPPAGEWKVEVAYEDSDEKVEPKNLEPGGLDFELPESWVKQPGSRFVTVYLKKVAPAADKPEAKEEQEADGENGQRETTKGYEEPTTIIRIIPASVARDDEQDFDDEAAEDADD
jgi:hypothetical protein